MDLLKGELDNNGPNPEYETVFYFFTTKIDWPIQSQHKHFFNEFNPGGGIDVIAPKPKHGDFYIHRKDGSSQRKAP